MVANNSDEGYLSSALIQTNEWIRENNQEVIGARATHLTVYPTDTKQLSDKEKTLLKQLCKCSDYK